MNGWQEIKTAPKDRLIDVWHQQAGEKGRRLASAYYDSICGEWRTSRPGGLLVCVREKFFTHWMPVPDPPA